MTNTNTTETLAPELVTLREAYIAQVRALIAKYPAQAANEGYLLHQAATAQLAVMRSEVRTKGDFSVLLKGELVLAWPPGWALATSITVWHPRNPCQTSVTRYAAEVRS